MSYNEIGKYSTANLRGWSIQAAECFNINCECIMCKVPRIMDSKCEMKATVLELYKRFGRPTSENTKREYTI